MATILSYTNQQLIKKISANNAQKYDEIAREVEEFDLKEILGIALLQDIQANPTTPTNIKLLTGDIFTDVYGNNVNHKGLNYVIAYLNYARYIGKSFAVDTFSGMVQKNRDDSTQLSEGSLKRLIEDSRKIALSEFSNIKWYLDENATLFPLWNFYQSRDPYPPKIKSIRKTGHHRSLTDYKLDLIRRQYKP
jgi:hypothetical protein